MQCTSCGGELRLGKLKFSDKLRWVAEENKGNIFKQMLSSDTVFLSEQSFGRFQSISAYCCEECRMIIIKY